MTSLGPFFYSLSTLSSWVEEKQKFTSVFPQEVKPEKPWLQGECAPRCEDMTDHLLKSCLLLSKQRLYGACKAANFQVMNSLSK